MKALRFGSYSSRSTVAGTSNLRRLKSTLRYDCLCPPPRNRTEVVPWLLRPPECDLPTVKALTGLPFHSSERSISTVPRRLAVTGLNCLSAMFPSSPAPYVSPAVKSISCPWASWTNAFLTSERLPGRPLNRLVLPFCTSVFTATTLTPNSPSTASLICGFVAFSATRNITWLCCDTAVDFSVTIGLRISAYIASRVSVGLRGFAAVCVSLMPRLLHRPCRLPVPNRRRARHPIQVTHQPRMWLPPPRRAAPHRHWPRRAHR